MPREQGPERSWGMDPAQEAAQRKLHTIVFDDEAEYVRFVDHVYEQYGGGGLELTNVPIITSVRVQSWLLERTREQFAMHSVTQEDVDRAVAPFRGRKPFDPKNLDDFHVPGVPRPEKER